MTTLLLITRPQLAAKYLRRIDGPTRCLIPADTEDIWRAAGVGVPLHPVASWHDYTGLAATIAAMEPTRIIGTDELTVAAAGYLRSLRGLPGQQWEQAVAFTDKAVMKRRLRDAHVPVADWRVVHTFGEVIRTGDRLGWPVVVKPRRGFGTLSTVRVDSPRHLDELRAAGRFDGGVPPGDGARVLQGSGIYDALTASADGFLVEQCVDVAHEFSCDIVFWQGRPHLTLTTRYSATLLEAFGSGDYVDLDTVADDDPAGAAVRAITLRAVEVLGLSTGQVHCEVFQTRAGDYVLGEIACRAGGAALPALSAFLYGVDTVEAGINIAFGHEPELGRATTHSPIAVVGVPPRMGLVRQAPEPAALEALPGVLHAEVRLRPGELVGGGLGSSGAAAYLFLDASRANDQCRNDVRAAAAAMFVVEDGPELQAARPDRRRLPGAASTDSPDYSPGTSRLGARTAAHDDGTLADSVSL